MSQRGEGVSLSVAAPVAAGVGVVSWLGLLGWRGLGREFPQLPWLGLIPMALLAVLVLYAAWKIRQYVHGAGARFPSTFQPTPQQARGTLVAAQAAALGGAALVGFYAANAAVHVSAVDVPSVRDLFVRAVVSALAAGLLSLSGFAAQAMCRLPEDEDDDHPSGRADDPGEDGIVYG